MVYILNVTALALLFIRGVLACVELNTIIYNYYNWQLHWYPDGPALQKSQGVSTATEVLNWFVDAAIYGSLVLQVHIVCCTLRHTYKLAILGVCGMVSLVALGVRLYLAVYNIKYVIIGLRTTTYAEQLRFNYIGSVDNIVSVATIALFSAIFVTKLGFAIHLRRKLNMKQFGPMQIIFVMGCQTLCIPRKFCRLRFRSKSYVVNSCQSSLPLSRTTPSLVLRSTAWFQPSSPSSSRFPACGLRSRPISLAWFAQMTTTIALSLSAPHS